MDGKTVSNNLAGILPLAEIKPKEGIKSAKSDADRDANGQQAYQKPSKDRELTEEEIEQAIKIIENLPGFKKNNLSLKKVDHIYVIEDSEGNTIRRMNSLDLVQLLDQNNDKKGNIFKRSA